MPNDESVTPASRAGAGRGVRGKLIALAAGTAVALVFAEVSLRVIGAGSPVFHRPDAVLGTVLIPGATGWYTAEGRAWVKINSAGMRDVEHTVVKPANTVRIAVVGDSYAEALQVPRDSTFWSVLGEQLDSCALFGKAKAEVLNFGVSGYSTAQEYLLLQGRVLTYQPDIVLLAFLAGNDVSDNHPALSAGRRPFFRLERGELRLDDTRINRTGTAEGAARWLLRHSRLLQLANVVRVNIATCGQAGSCGQDLDAALGEAGLLNQVYLAPTEPRWREAWDVTEALLAGMDSLVRAQHARLVVVTVPNSIQVNPDAAARDAFRRAIRAPDLSYADRRLTAWAARQGVAALPLAPSILRQAEAAGTFLHGWAGPYIGKGHWNAGGHRVAGQAIGRWMCSDAAGPDLASENWRK